MDAAGFFTEARVSEMAPALGELARICKLPDAAHPIIFTTMAALMCLKNQSISAKDCKLVIEARAGRIEWTLRDPTHGDRVCTSGTFRGDGMPICDGAADVLSLGT
jgi:hypothetical protein